MKTFIKKNTWTLTMFGSGWGNGYVLIPKGHSLHGVHYDNIDVDVHGRLTFSQEVDSDLLTHWKELDENDIGKWVVGFDTSHLGDTLENWTEERVEIETEYLKQQLVTYQK